MIRPPFRVPLLGVILGWSLVHAIQATAIISFRYSPPPDGIVSLCSRTWGT